jgi:hypothetical protein
MIVYLCDPLDSPDGLLVILATSIHSIVSMFPDMEITQVGHISETGKFSLMRHTYIELAHITDGGLFDDDNDSV